MEQMAKKPQCVTVHQYMLPIGVLNDHLSHLPTVYDLSMAMEGTNKSKVAFNKTNLARVVLNSVPPTWPNQYNMMHNMFPKSPHFLLPDLEAIEHVMNEKHIEELKAEAKEASSASASAKGSPKKQSVSGGTGE
jgi:hypothetical protein